MTQSFMKRLNGLIPLPKLVRFVIGISVAAQMIVIIYNNSADSTHSRTSPIFSCASPAACFLQSLLQCSSLFLTC